MSRQRDSEDLGVANRLSNCDAELRPVSNNLVLNCIARASVDALMHVAAPERGESSANEEVATAKGLELVGPSDHGSVAIGFERPPSTQAVNEPP
jgi:hypothetical protein